MSHKAAPVPRITAFRLSESDRLRLEFAAALAKQRPSDVLRRALQQYLAAAAIPQPQEPTPSA